MRRTWLIIILSNTAEQGACTCHAWYPARSFWSDVRHASVGVALPPTSIFLQVKLEDAEQKRTVAEGIAENVSREKAIVEVETAKAQVQAEQVAKTQAEVSR